MSETQLQFTGTRKDLGWLHWRGFWLSILTLGIYRFWFKTKQRQYLWNSIEFNNESLEYTGTGKELFKGFLFALIFIVPLQIGFLVAGLTTFQFQIIAILLVIGIFLSYFAMFAARRYRLTRTLWRGLRFRMEGSGWHYAIRAFGWWVFTLVTFGFASPWGKVYLEKYKMQRTFYGDVQGQFTGDPKVLFKKTFIIMLLAALPLLLVLYNLLSQISWGDWRDLFAAISTNDEEIIADVVVNLGLLKTEALAFYGSLLPLSLFFTILCFPALQAINFKWWANGVKLGEASLTSTFTIKQSYKIWLKFLIMSLAFSFALSLILGGLGLAGAFFGKDILASMDKNTLMALGGIVGGLLYLGFIFIFLLIKTLYITFSYWRDETNSLTLHNLASLESVAARNQSTSALGEGLDASDIGGFGGF